MLRLNGLSTRSVPVVTSSTERRRSLVRLDDADHRGAMDLPHALVHRARHQGGVVSRGQLVDSGVSGAEISLAGPTALDLRRRSSSSPSQRVYVLVPPSHRSRDVTWLSIRRIGFTDERAVDRGPLRFSCLPRALVDTAAASPDDFECRAFLIDAVHRRVVRLDDVSHSIDVRRPNGRTRLRRALAEAAAGAWSLPEAELTRLVATSRVLPQPWPNPELSDLAASD